MCYILDTSPKGRRCIMTDEDYSNQPLPNSPEGSEEQHKDWDSDEALEFLKQERTVFGAEDTLSNIELTRKLIEEAAPMAAMSMIHLSRHAMNENTRAGAAKWVVEFATQVQTEEGRAAWEKILPSVVQEAEKITVAASAQGDNETYEIGD